MMPPPCYFPIVFRRVRHGFAIHPRTVTICFVFLACTTQALPSSQTLDSYFRQAREMENRQDYAAAARVYQEAAASFPKQPEILKRLGIVYQTELKFQDSITSFEKVLAAAPLYPEVNFY